MERRGCAKFGVPVLGRSYDVDTTGKCVTHASEYPLRGIWEHASAEENASRLWREPPGEAAGIEDFKIRHHRRD